MFLFGDNMNKELWNTVKANDKRIFDLATYYGTKGYTVKNDPEEILNRFAEFKFRRFRLSGVSKPQIYVESSDHFIVVLSIETVFDDSVVIYKDDLKLKTVSSLIFDGTSNNPLTDQ